MKFMLIIGRLNQRGGGQEKKQDDAGRDESI